MVTVPGGKLKAQTAKSKKSKSDENMRRAIAFLQAPSSGMMIFSVRFTIGDAKDLEKPKMSRGREDFDLARDSSSINVIANDIIEAVRIVRSTFGRFYEITIDGVDLVSDFMSETSVQQLIDIHDSLAGD